MQINKKLLSMFIMVIVSVPCLALPPFQILRTCMDREPYEHMSTISEMDGDGYAKTSLDGCKDQYDRTYNNHLYGTVMCHKKFYLIIKDKKIDPERAVNKSMNPEINPGVVFPTGAIWYKIGYDNKDYLCIYAPLSEQGIGSAHIQYYIIENAFDETIEPKVYYYFLDKNIAPIISNTF